MSLFACGFSACAALAAAFTGHLGWCASDVALVLVNAELGRRQWRARGSF